MPLKLFVLSALAIRTLADVLPLCNDEQAADIKAYIGCGIVDLSCVSIRVRIDRLVSMTKKLSELLGFFRTFAMRSMV